MFTPEELAEMAAADAEIKKEFRLTQEKLRERARNYMREYRAKKRAAAGAVTPTTAKK